MEIEIRFRISDAKKLRRKLRELGSKCIERWRGRDILFDKNDELTSRDRLLRLRLGGQRGKRGRRGKLTYKGPYKNHTFKVREEFETIVESAEIAMKILAALGYLPTVQFEKRTELWKYAKVEIYIDEMPKTGLFMEIEGSEKNIKKVAKTLGFDTKEGIKKSYCEFFAELDKNKKEWLFDRR